MGPEAMLECLNSVSHLSRIMSYVHVCVCNDGSIYMMYKSLGFTHILLLL